MVHNHATNHSLGVCESGTTDNIAAAPLVAVYAHRATYELRMFSLLELQGRLQTNSHMAITGDSLDAISGI